MQRYYLLPLVLMLLFPAAGTARDIIVDNVRGDDLNLGLAHDSVVHYGGPCRSIAKALRLARPGDRIVLTDTGEPYRESISLEGARHSGAAATPFILHGGGAILDGSVEVPHEHWEHFEGEVFRVRPRRMAYQQLFLEGRPVDYRPLEQELTLPELDRLEWTLLDGYIYFRVEKDKLPQDYPLRYAGHSVGITLYNVTNVIVSDITVQGFQLDGINAHDNVFRCTLGGVLSRGNGRSGISVGGASRVRIESTLLGNNGAAQLRTEGWSETTLVDCELLDNTAPPLVKEDGSRVYELDQPAQP